MGWGREIEYEKERKTSRASNEGHSEEPWRISAHEQLVISMVLKVEGVGGVGPNLTGRSKACACCWREAGYRLGYIGKTHIGIDSVDDIGITNTGQQLQVFPV